MFLRDNYYRTRLAFYRCWEEFRVENQIALIAGEGTLPVVIASRLTDMGRAPVVYSVRENIG